MIVVIYDEHNINFSEMLIDFFRESKIAFLNANDFNIEPCLACGSCSGKTYGHCVLKDDFKKILKYILNATKIIYISPIIFGSVSFHIKKIMDRLSSVGDPRYYIKDGQLVKKMRIANLQYYMIGYKEGLTYQEREAFLKLHKENIKIMNVLGKGYIIEGKIEKDKINNIIKEIIND